MPASDSTCWMIEHGEARQRRAGGGDVKRAAFRLNHVGTKLNEAKELVTPSKGRIAEVDDVCTLTRFQDK